MNPTEPVSPRHPLSRLLQGTILSVIAFLNDRLLPADRPLNAQGVWAQIEGLLVWCEHFLQQHDPGPLQYRGRPMDPQATTGAACPVQFRYRGLTVERDIPEAEAKTADLPSPYIPPYQRRLQIWLLNLGLADADRYSSAPNLDPAYRGQKL